MFFTVFVFFFFWDNPMLSPVTDAAIAGSKKCFHSSGSQIVLQEIKCGDCTFTDELNVWDLVLQTTDATYGSRLTFVQNVMFTLHVHDLTDISGGVGGGAAGSEADKLVNTVRVFVSNMLMCETTGCLQTSAQNMMSWCFPDPNHVAFVPEP